MTIEIKRTKASTTQGMAQVWVNGEMVIEFGDKIELIDGEWKSAYTDEYLIAAYFKNHYKPGDIKDISSLSRDAVKVRDDLGGEVYYGFNMGCVLMDNPGFIPTLKRFVELCRTNRNK